MADQTEPKPLSFSTVLEGQPITIDGVPYLIKHPDSFSLEESGEIEIDRIRVLGLLKVARRTRVQNEALLDLMKGLLLKVSDVPAEVLAKLYPTQIIEAAMAFMWLRSGQRAAAEAMQELTSAIEATVTAPGNLSSQDSVDSMAAIHGTGSPASHEP